MINIILKIKISFLFSNLYNTTILFSNTVKYALKACLYLAVNSCEDKKLMIKDIATPINVPKAYIAKILQALSNKNLISSKRGPKGGFYLQKKHYQIKIIDIIEAVDGEDHINSCLLSLKTCNSNNPCSLHHLVYSEKEKIYNKLRATTLEDLKNHIQSGKSILPF